MRTGRPPLPRPEIEQPMDHSIRHIPLTKGHFSIVDADDAPFLSMYSWHSVSRKGSRTIYAKRNKLAMHNETKRMAMHEVIMARPAGMSIDHINGNGLDNRRCNLRVCTHAENSRNTRHRSDNTSGHKGVRFQKSSGNWVAEISAAGVRHYLGSYAEKSQAVAAYQAAAAEKHGNFARVK